MSDTEVYKQLRDFAARYEIMIITAKQPTYPPGYVAPKLPQSDIVIIDYISKLP